MNNMKKKDVVYVVIASALYNVSSVVFSFILMDIVDSITKNNYKAFETSIIWALMTILLQIVFFATYNVVKGKITQKQMVDIRTNMLKGIFKFDISHFHKSEVDEYVSFFYNDIGFLKEKYIYKTYDLVENIGMFFLALIGIIWIYPFYLIAIIFVVSIAFLLPIVFGKKSIRYMSSISGSSQRLMLWLQNMLKGFDTVRFYKIEEKIVKEGKDVITDFEDTEYKFDLFMNFVQIGLNFIMTILTLLTYVVGGYLVIKGQITLGALIALAQLLFKVASPIMAITSAVTDINSTKDIRKKLEKIENYCRKEKKKLVYNISSENVIHIDQVKFSYIGQEKKTLNNISYDFKKGRKYAIIGENGCGKSTLMKLLAGYSDEYEGHIELYGNELKELLDEDIFRNVSYISQESFVFNKSIRENIFVTEPTQRDQREAERIIKTLHFQTVLEKHPEGTEYILNTSENLSGGEIQKISIIRALMKKGNILLMDEGDSNLDTKSREALYNLIRECDYDLVIVITHHLEKENVKFFDEVISMENGRIIK
jgi:ABC-type bacteriocin/lantibiotic exporters, contain an N-terminal double-glycine peptidase domain